MIRHGIALALGAFAAACATFSTEGTAKDGGAPANDASVCPGVHGPPMIRVGGYCIDATDVTVAQYKEFVDAKGADTSGQIDSCAGNVSWLPNDASAWKVAPGTETLPVIDVDWCDATAYCAWAGKRLCGKIGAHGGPLATSPSANFSDAKMDEWFAACSRGGQREFPYGDTYQAGRCNTGRTAAVSDVKSFAGCEGGYDGLFDMSGNAAQWIDSCTSYDPTASCATHGSGYYEDETVASCASFRTHPRDFHFHIGIRCCAD